MVSRDPRVDAYIANAAEFARPILEHLRELVHRACPEVLETIKWSMPFFDHQGSLCHMAAFKKHCAFGFWKGDLVIQGPGASEAMGQFGRLTALADLPAEKKLLAYLKRAAKLNSTGVKPARALKQAKPPPVAPDYFRAALNKNKKALASYEGFSPSNQREYVDWLTEAKTESTRIRRLTQALLWLQEGKVRHWKYLDC